MSRHYKHFSRQEHEFIRTHYMRLSNRELAAKLCRTESSITWQLQRLGLSRGLTKSWTRQEIAAIRRLAPTLTRKEMAAQFGVTEASIKAVMKTNGIRTGRSGRFKPGQTPWSKGKKMPVGWGGATRFKKGRQPHNTRHDGATTVRSYRSGHRYTWIRTGLNQWQLLHRVVWEQTHGPVPAGMLVAFRDGNTLNCTPSNLYLETMQEHMARNSFARFNPELRSAIRLLSSFKRKIKTYEKQD
jgi:hypothetical protein